MNCIKLTDQVTALTASIELNEQAIKEARNNISNFRAQLEELIYTQKLYSPLSCLLKYAPNSDTVKFESITVIDSTGVLHYIFADTKFILHKATKMIEMSDTNYVGTININTGEMIEYVHQVPCHSKIIGVVNVEI